MSTAPALLVVDDDSDVRTVLRRGFETAGFEVLTAPDGFQALQVLSDRPDIEGVLADILMPNLDGPAFVSMARSRGLGQQAAFYLMSGLPPHGSADTRSELAIAGTIQKPFDLRALTARIDGDLRRNRERTDADREDALDGWVSAGVGWMTRALDWKDQETGAHCCRVATYSRILAEAMGVPKALVDDIVRVAPLHDIGKIGVPDTILNKPAPLDAGEIAVVRRHAEIGHAILAAEPHRLSALAAQIALHHHDRFDGTGYSPLAGHAIPLPARIVALADIYDALRSARPYKRGLTHAEATRCILVGDGRTMPEHFDPCVLAAFHRSTDAFVASDAT